MPEGDAPLVSVIVPVFAGERFLAQALDSVLAQSYSPIETIVVDDGSPDASAAIAAARAEVRLVRQARGGVAAARNTGLGHARGALIAFLDQDDEWLEHRLATQVRYLDEHAEVSIALAHMQMVLMQDTPRPPWFRPHWLTDAQPGYTPSTWLVRREAFARVGAFDTSFEVASDSDWLARAKDAGLGSAMLDEVLVRWRVHGANGTYDQQTMRREILRMARGSASRQRRATREQGESGRVA